MSFHISICPSKNDIETAYKHAVWLRAQVNTGEGRMLSDLGYEVQWLREQLASMTKERDEARAEAAELRKALSEIEDHNEYLIQKLMLDDFKRIDAMPPEELEAELLADGWTKERLEASAQKVKAMLHKALEDRAAEALKGQP